MTLNEPTSAVIARFYTLGENFRTIWVRLPKFGSILTTSYILDPLQHVRVTSVSPQSLPTRQSFITYLLLSLPVRLRTNTGLPPPICLIHLNYMLVIIRVSTVTTLSTHPHKTTKPHLRHIHLHDQHSSYYFSYSNSALHKHKRIRPSIIYRVPQFKSLKFLYPTNILYSSLCSDRTYRL